MIVDCQGEFGSRRVDRHHVLTQKPEIVGKNWRVVDQRALCLTWDDEVVGFHGRVHLLQIDLTRIGDDIEGEVSRPVPDDGLFGLFNQIFNFVLFLITTDKFLLLPLSSLGQVSNELYSVSLSSSKYELTHVSCTKRYPQFFCP